MSLIQWIAIGIIVIIFTLVFTFFITWMKFKKIIKNADKNGKEVKDNGRTETDKGNSGTEKPTGSASEIPISTGQDRIPNGESGSNGNDSQTIKLFKPADIQF